MKIRISSVLLSLIHVFGAPRTLGVAATAMISLTCFGASAHAAGGRSLVRTSALVPSAGAPIDASGEIMLCVNRKRVEFTIEAENLAAGAYSILLDGTERGVLIMDAPLGVAIGSFDTFGEIRFSSKPARHANAFMLDFDPAGGIVEIAQAGQTLLSGVAPDIDIFAPPRMAPGAAAPRQKIAAPMVGSPDARGRLILKSGRKGVNLTIKVKGLSLGEHRLFVNGEDAGGLLLHGARANILFSTRPRRNRQLLSFDPTNSTYEIRKGGSTVLRGTLRGVDIPGLDPIGQASSPLFPTAIAPSAVGEALLITRGGATTLTITAADAPNGVHEVRIDGQVVGDMIVLQGRGELLLAQDSQTASAPNATPISFDPRGRVVQILLSGDVVLGGEVPGVRLGDLPKAKAPATVMNTINNITNITNNNNTTTIIDNSVTNVDNSAESENHEGKESDGESRDSSRENNRMMKRGDSQRRDRDDDVDEHHDNGKHGDREARSERRNDNAQDHRSHDLHGRRSKVQRHDGRTHRGAEHDRNQELVKK